MDLSFYYSRLPVKCSDTPSTNVFIIAFVHILEWKALNYEMAKMELCEICSDWKG